MKKFLFLSLILLCTAMSAWSYTTGSVTLRNYESEKTTDPTTGISVKAAQFPGFPLWVVFSELILEVPQGYIITGVRFIYCAEEFLQLNSLTYGSIKRSNKLVLNGETWEQSDGAFSYYSSIRFFASSDKAYVTAVEITYHKHEFHLAECFHEGVAATCTTPGMKEYWECSGCGHIYPDYQGFEELSEASLVIPAINHKNKIYVEAKPATDTEDGCTVGHWHCPDCGKNFVDEECTEQITENVIIRAKSRDWLCFTANTANSTVELDKVGNPYEATLEYTTTETTWVPYTFGQTITLASKGDFVRFRNASDDLAEGFSKSFTDYYQFAMTGSVAASGNVMSLIDKTCKATTFPTEGVGCFACLFSGCTSLTSAPELPAATLVANCYHWMFGGCTGLTEAPALPAKTLASGCYDAMFDNCTGLTQAPALPATTMAVNSYASMFRGCTSLTEAPALPAMTLADACYLEMFYGCTSLTTAPVLPATTLTLQCYKKMFEGCTSLTAAPELPATTLASECYGNMFNGCTSLTTAPELPATTPAPYCYERMFYGCAKLSIIEVGFTSWVAHTENQDAATTHDWLNGVASTGTFSYPTGLTQTTGTSNIPSGWTVTNTYDLTISSASGWASLCVNLPLQVPAEDVAKVYYASAVDGTTIELTQIAAGTVMAAKTAVIVKGTGTVSFPIAGEAGTSYTNLFQGSSVANTCNAREHYVLNAGESSDDNVRFSLYTGTTLGAHKIWLPKSAVGGASSIQFRFGDATAVSTVETEAAEDVIYNLAGQRVGSDYRGIVIRNGKKMYNK